MEEEDIIGIWVEGWCQGLAWLSECSLCCCLECCVCTGHINFSTDLQARLAVPMLSKHGASRTTFTVLRNLPMFTNGQTGVAPAAVRAEYRNAVWAVSSLANSAATLPTLELRLALVQPTSNHSLALLFRAKENKPPTRTNFVIGLT